MHGIYKLTNNIHIIGTLVYKPIRPDPQICESDNQGILGRQNQGYTNQIREKMQNI